MALDDEIFDFRLGVDVFQSFFLKCFIAIEGRKKIQDYKLYEANIMQSLIKEDEKVKILKDYINLFFPEMKNFKNVENTEEQLEILQNNIEEYEKHVFLKPGGDISAIPKEFQNIYYKQLGGK